MEDFIKLLRRKSHILYDMNSIQKYIHDGEYDQNLKQAWDNYEEELKNIEEILTRIRTTELVELEAIRYNLISQIKEYEKKIVHLKQQVKDVDTLILNQE